MANVVTGNPWILDTTGAVTTKRVPIKMIRYVGGASGNISILTTAAATIFWNATAPADNFLAQTVFDQTFFSGGLTVTTTGGVTYVYLDTKQIPFTV